MEIERDPSYNEAAMAPSDAATCRKLIGGYTICTLDEQGEILSVVKPTRRSRPRGRGAEGMEIEGAAAHQHHHHAPHEDGVVLWAASQPLRHPQQVSSLRSTPSGSSHYHNYDDHYTSPPLTPAPAVPLHPSMPCAMPYIPDEAPVEVVLDAANVGMHDLRKADGPIGLNIDGVRVKSAVEWFLSRGVRCAAFISNRVFHQRDGVTEGWMDGNANMQTEQIDVLRMLVKQGLLATTPPNEEDDVYILAYAESKKAHIVSNDFYRDHCSRCPYLRPFVKHYRIPFSFFGQDFIPSPSHPFIQDLLSRPRIRQQPRPPPPQPQHCHPQHDYAPQQQHHHHQYLDHQQHVYQQAQVDLARTHSPSSTPTPPQPTRPPSPPPLPQPYYAYVPSPSLPSNQSPPALHSPSALPQAMTHANNFHDTTALLHQPLQAFHDQSGAGWMPQLSVGQLGSHVAYSYGGHNFTGYGTDSSAGVGSPSQVGLTVAGYGSSDTYMHAQHFVP